MVVYMLLNGMVTLIRIGSESPRVHVYIVSHNVLLSMYIVGSNILTLLLAM